MNAHWRIARIAVIVISICGFIAISLSMFVAHQMGYPPDGGILPAAMCLLVGFLARPENSASAIAYLLFLSLLFGFCGFEFTYDSLVLRPSTLSAAGFFYLISAELLLLAPIVIRRIRIFRKANLKF